jgi:nitroimidazol reductase NimA-like FMN-containing flavoprotein (pyridoxamine 5'-phosphate oxidase superfamily)
MFDLDQAHEQPRSDAASRPRNGTVADAAMEIDRNGLEVLGRAEALRLLASKAIGRIGVHVGALPVVLPVNFVVTDDEIVIRTTTGTKLAAATQHAVVAFEVDDFDGLAHSGWSVVVTGVARPITAPDDLARARSLPLTSWANGETDHYIAISTELVSGRRILPPPQRGAHR